MAAFLHFIIFLLLAFVFIAGIFVYQLYRRIYDVADRFRQASGFGTRQTHTSTYNDQEGVIDRRSPEEANKKIFAQNEGEYVDYVETEES